MRSGALSTLDKSRPRKDRAKAGPIYLGLVPQAMGKFQPTVFVVTQVLSLIASLVFTMASLTRAA